MSVTAPDTIAFAPTHNSLDDLVRQRLRQWPQSPPGSVLSSKQAGIWMRGRPGPPRTTSQPFLKFPGTSHLRTLPDGLWLHFSPDPSEPYADILCIEACSSLQNLLDKRSRFAATTNSLLAVCPLAWLLAPAQENVGVPRWRLIRMIRREPTEALVLPVRDIRVLYGLKRHHYEGFARTQMPQAHEYFCPMDALTDERGDENPAMRALISRASDSANFMHLPETPPARPVAAVPRPHPDAPRPPSLRALRAALGLPALRRSGTRVAGRRIVTEASPAPPAQPGPAAS